jgi:hypothetical protein
MSSEPTVGPGRCLRLNSSHVRLEHGRRRNGSAENLGIL